MDLYDSDLGTLLCLCIKAMFRQAAQSFWSDHPYQTAKSVCFLSKKKSISFHMQHVCKRKSIELQTWRRAKKATVGPGQMKTIRHNSLLLTKT